MSKEVDSMEQSVYKSETQKRRKESKSVELETEKSVMEEELGNLKESEEESLLEQMMVNKALEIEKQVAEKEAEDWKRKFEKLAEAVRKLDEIGAFKDVKMDLDENLKQGGLELASVKFHEGAPGSPYITTPIKDNIVGRRRDNLSSRARVNKMLVFDLSDSETEESKEKESGARDTLEEGSIEDEDVEACDVNTNTPLIPGRKRRLVISSDSENDNEDEDNIPLSTLKMPDLVDTPGREENGSGRSRRTQRSRVSARLNKQRVSKEISASTEEESESERSHSLDDFIVDDDDDDDDSHENSEETREEESDGETSYVDIISRLRRDKNPNKINWEYEADMLADFGKYPELCMRAVCVLYSFQTDDEKVSSSTHVWNGRGFSKFDAVRGTRIGEFLTNGDPVCDLKRSVEELESFELDGVETCRSLAAKYSKQLFQIYNNREVPFFSLPLSPRRGE